MNSTAAFVQEALQIIERSYRPVATGALVESLQLNKNQAMTLRRALKREERLGRLLCIGTDDITQSFLWVDLKRHGGDMREVACVGAALAVEMCVRRVLCGAQIDLDECVEALRPLVRSGVGTEGRLT